MRTRNRLLACVPFVGLAALAAVGPATLSGQPEPKTAEDPKNKGLSRPMFRPNEGRAQAQGATPMAAAKQGLAPAAANTPKDVQDALRAAGVLAEVENDPVYVIPPEEIEPPSQSATAFALASGTDFKDRGHETVRVKEAWDVLGGAGKRGAGVRVAIVDSGIDLTHMDFTGGKVVAQRDFTGEGIQDGVGHGTHVAGIVAASENGGGAIGVAPDAQLVVVKVFTRARMTYSSWIADGIKWAANEGRADVINLSLGGRTPDARVRQAIQEVVTQNRVIVVAAAGNDFTNGMGFDPNVPVTAFGASFPGADPETVCVGAYVAHDPRPNPSQDQDARLRPRPTGSNTPFPQFALAPFSNASRNFGGAPQGAINPPGGEPEVDVAAPGFHVLSSFPPNTVAERNGTSMAAPYVAGVAALYVGCRLASQGQPKTWTPEEFRQLVRTTSEISPGSGLPRPNKFTGFGRILADKFVKPVTGPVDPGNGKGPVLTGEKSVTLPGPSLGLPNDVSVTVTVKKSGTGPATVETASPPVPVPTGGAPAADPAKGGTTPSGTAPKTEEKKEEKKDGATGPIKT